MLKYLGVATGIFAFVACTAVGANAQSKCSSAKVKNAGKYAAASGNCVVKAVNKGLPVDSECQTKAATKFNDSFVKAELKADCNQPNGDAPAIKTKTDDLVADIWQAVNGTGAGPSTCDSKKIKASTKKAKAVTNCFAKAINKGIGVDTECVTKAQDKHTAAIAKAELGDDCTNAGPQAATLEGIVDAYVADVVDEISPTGPSCCAATRIVTSSGAGLLQVSTLPPFPFPSGVITTVDAGAADSCCKHSATIPPGGFTVPVFCIPALGFTSSVTAIGCAAGSADGQGTVWDAAAGNSLPCCADGDVSRVGDTTDPDGNSCGTMGAGCNTGAGGAGTDTGGNINTTRGNGACDAGGVGTQLDIPVHSLTWNDADTNCPDDDLTFDPGTDVLVTDFNFILSPTTASSNADYTDLNADNCSFAGNGPDHVKHCSADAAHPNPLQTPCATNIQCGHCSVTTTQSCVQGAPSGCPAAQTCVAGSCIDGALQGIPPAGPCCTPGQSTTVVATGIAFTGGAPLYDLIFANSVPATISACNAPSSDTCTLVTDPCLD